MPESIKFDTTIDTITAYKQYLNTKPWLASNYLRIPSRKPSFITTMTTSLPVFDFSTSPEERAAEQAKQDAAIAAAEKAMKDAPAVRTIKSKASGLVPAKKSAAKKSGKAGRIVGISAAENLYIQELLDFVANDKTFGSSNPNYAKIQARYNK
jgi:hypothetical protein